MEKTAANGDKLDPFIARIRRENAIEAERAVQLHAEAFDEACRLALEMGKADPTLRKVVLFGSALPGRMYRTDSDIDFAIIGGGRALPMRRQKADFDRLIAELDADARDFRSRGLNNQGRYAIGQTPLVRERNLLSFPSKLKTVPCPDFSQA